MNRVSTAALIALFCSATLHAQARASSSARLAVSSGIVEVQRGTVWSPVRAGEALQPAERLRTSNGSWAALEFDSNRIITLTERTEILVPPSNGVAAVQLEGGSIKVFAATDVLIAAKDTVLETAERPLDLELGYQGDQLNLTVFNGAVRNGSLTVRGNQETNTPNVRTYSAGSHRPDYANGPGVYPNVYVYPYFMYGNRTSTQSRPPVRK
jgi:ferric-dicitrate binding protein FerR (iron transport regulator)